MILSLPNLTAVAAAADAAELLVTHSANALMGNAAMAIPFGRVRRAPWTDPTARPPAAAGPPVRRFCGLSKN